MQALHSTYNYALIARAVLMARARLEQLEPKKLELYFKAGVLEPRIFNFQQMVSWSLTSLFSTNTAISETKFSTNIYLFLFNLNFLIFI